MNRKSFIVLGGIVTVLVLVALVTIYVRTVARDKALNEANKTLFSEDTNAQFTDNQNNPVDLSMYENTVLVVNVWASWSPYTPIEFPILDEVATNYKDRGVKVLVMNRKENQSQIERYLATIPQYKNLEQIVDVNDFFYAGIDGYAMPETIIYDAKGQIIEHIRGVVTKEILENTLNSILEAQS